MARFLASTACPLLCPGKPTRCVKMMCSLQPSPVLRIQPFSGLRASNALGLTTMPVQGFVSKVNRSISSKKGRASRCVTKAMFERFTVEAIKVITLSQREARRVGYNFVGTEQILLALIMEETGIAAKVFESMGIDLEYCREEVEKIIGRGSGIVAKEIPFTPRAKRVLELSLEEARQLGHNYIGTEHLLLGLLCEGEGVAARVLENMGADPSYIWELVIRMIEEKNKNKNSGDQDEQTENDEWI